jgi:predicted transcriptional regulator
MNDPTADKLSRRERQIMDVLFRQGTATAAEVREQLHEPPSYSAVRALLRVMEEKGYVSHDRDGARYVYRPTVRRETARRSALRDLVTTFFDDSAEDAMAALLEMKDTELSPESLDRMQALIEDARREGR